MGQKPRRPILRGQGRAISLSISVEIVTSRDKCPPYSYQASPFDVEAPGQKDPGGVRADVDCGADFAEEG